MNELGSHKDLKRAPVTIALFNVKFSENLGDGMISEAIEDGLSSVLECKTTVCDVAGRSEYGEETFRHRSAKLAVLESLPEVVGRKLSKIAVASKISKHLELWQSTIESSEHVVIGGGHLFQDDNLNLPQKIGAVLDLCAQKSIPLSVFAVGVTKDWSTEARDLFWKLLECNVASVSVRDETSRENWSGHFAGTALEFPQLSLDPVLARVSKGKRAATDRIGLGITHPRCIARHSVASSDNLIDRFADIATHLAASGYRVALFTNGAREDCEALAQVAARPDVAEAMELGQITALDRPETPRELARQIETFDCVVAHRLHACIGAFASGVPSVGLGWDEKLESFFGLTERSGFFVSADEIGVEKISHRVAAACAEGISPSVRQNIAERSREGIEELGQLIHGCALGNSELVGTKNEGTAKSRRLSTG